MLTNLLNSPAPGGNALMEKWIVPILSFGPLYIVIGSQADRPLHGILGFSLMVFTYVGALCLSFGLLYLRNRQVVLQRRLDEMEKSRTPTL